ncbi:DUF502 domain-containing protein [Nitrosomonadales bacterium]|nr:DUF502 domain-containing protein [Nitrosomonadales bacterium]
MKKNFITGLLVLIPLILTFWVLFSLIKFLDQVLFLLPETLRPDYILGIEVFGFGVILTFIIILLTGIIANNFFGKKIITLYEVLLNKLPFVKSIYKSIKQVSDTLLSSSGNAFTKAVLIEFPISGTYTFAFITGEPDQILTKNLKGKYLNVYVPTTPNPTSGYTLMVPRDKVVELDIGVDQVLKYVISMGVVPGDKKLKQKK